MLNNTEYIKIITEMCDLSDYRTKKAMIFCDESTKTKNVEGIVANLYQHIKNNVNGINFGTIPDSKGIIENVENFPNLVNCINSVHDLVKSYNENTAPVDVFSTAIDNIKNRERLFTKAFALNIEFPMMMYNMTVMSIVSSVSLLISASIEFVKEGHNSFKESFDKVGYRKSKDNVLYEYIIQFNNNCKNGTIDKIISTCMKNNLVATKESYIEKYELIKEDNEFSFSIDNGIKAGIIGAVSTIAASSFGQAILMIPAAISLIVFFLWVMRKAIYYLLRTRLGLSEWFEAQATYLQINAENLKYRDDDYGDDHRNNVYMKQIRWVEKFRKISNFLALKNSKVTKEVKDAIDNDSNNTKSINNLESDNGLF